MVLKNPVIREISQLNICSLRTNDYGNKLDKFDELVRLAQIDFPFLTRSHIRIVMYGGQLNRMMAIMFEVPSDVIVPETYVPLRDLEYTK